MEVFFSPPGGDMSRLNEKPRPVGAMRGNDITVGSLGLNWEFEIWCVQLEYVTRLWHMLSQCNGVRMLQDRTINNAAPYRPTLSCEGRAWYWGTKWDLKCPSFASLHISITRFCLKVGGIHQQVENYCIFHNVGEQLIFRLSALFYKGYVIVSGRVVFLSSKRRWSFYSTLWRSEAAILKARIVGPIHSIRIWYANVLRCWLTKGWKKKWRKSAHANCVMCSSCIRAVCQ